ncbi:MULTISPECIES: nitrous oxide reductase family maturation protein NosD [Flavobacterium]|jgi:parallel beta-helix repeat (two copies)|uniref:Nitrous oxidase accessory protein n=5 Tax=Flavobacterium TaxID=237 RepID=A0A7W7N868_9FLAO|nr:MULTISPECIES: nitrous oxide reductase family maturation protein NosD [Flavobacterium]KRB55476.1 nitrous oxide reductase [Flavobacterium sp. Root186]MBB4802067.1 nitrous oxidase accessory protein [Flavobacterium nitrogenifigens]MBB6387025.1 nitrous oxidase accessory protein [Flavobacterium notoginsengisoli]MCC9064922.1 nitrous oxide reductase family maturation protein NosD [Flavobacterium sp. F-30]MWB93041.1 nitrous oxide reductase family maturation protein NosD [Flavobacterium hydrocarbonox
MKILLCLCFSFFFTCLHSQKIEVGKNRAIKTIKKAIQLANPGDTVLVYKGVYREGNIVIDKKIILQGIGFPILDGQKKYEVVSIKADSVTIAGFKVINSGYASLNDPCGIKIYNKTGVTIKENILENNFFGIYVQKGIGCIIKNNTIKAHQKQEQRIGNGIHCWKSENLQIVGNQVSGHRDGIYFEFVSNSIIWRNISKSNIRYGLHFMFSNDDSYISNVFKNNGAGVAVMFTKNVKMFHNYFAENWGDAAYGLLLKEISDSYIIGNKFIRNTSGIYMEGTSRVALSKNIFRDNGWGMKIQASCMENEISFNNFIANTFDISTNGSLVLNHFNNNYWDKYEGYDLNKDGIGDVPFHPLSLFAVLTENNPSAMLLFRSFMITLLDKSEKILPSITPDNFVDQTPEMKSLVL